MSSAPQNTNVDVSSSTTASVDAIEWPQSANVAPTLTVAGTLDTGSDPSTLNELDVSGGAFGAGSGGVSAGTFSGAGGELDGLGTLTVTGSATISSFFLAQSAAHLLLDGTSDVANYVHTPAGFSSGITYTYGAPTVTGISPTSGFKSGGTTVTITGTNFTPDSRVEFGTASATVTSVSPTQIKVNSPSVSSSGPVAVRVTTPAGTSATSSVFTYGP